MQSPQARSAWIEELRLAQLALDPNNSPAWDIPQESPYPLHKLPLFVKAIPLAKQPHLTVVSDVNPYEFFMTKTKRCDYYSSYRLNVAAFLPTLL